MQFRVSKFLSLIALPVSFGAIIGCSSGGASLTTEGVPSTDVTNYDYSLVSSGSTGGLKRIRGAEVVREIKRGKKPSLTSLVKDGLSLESNVRKFSAAPGQVGGFSRAGCETGPGKEHAFEAGRSAAHMQCIIEAMVEAGLFQEPSSTAQSYKLNIPAALDGEEGNAKVGYFKMQNDGSTLALQMCFDADFQTEEIRFGLDSSGKFAVSSRNRRTQDVSYTIPGQSPVTGVRKEQVQCDGTASADDDGDADFSCNFDSKFTPTGQSEADGFKGNIAFSKDADTTRNVLEAIYQDKFNGNDRTHSMYAIWNETLGSAKFSGTGTFPAFPCYTGPGSSFSNGDKCCFDDVNHVSYNEANHAAYDGPTAPDTTGNTQGDGLCPFSFTDTESFAITTTNEDGGAYEQDFTVVDDSQVSWFSDVSGHTLQSTVPSTTFAFVADEWDCVAETEITTAQFEAAMDVLEPAISACNAIMERGRDGNECHEIESEEQQKN